MPTADRILDVSGLACPLPVMKARKALRELPDGALLAVVATDPGAVADFAALCLSGGHSLLESRDEAGRYHFLIRNHGGRPAP